MYSNIFEKNLETVSKDLIGKDIIYSTQYISNDETQIDGDGPQSSWQIVFLCIEKTNDDYIFHLFESKFLNAYSYPYLTVINEFHPFTQKLSYLKEREMTISEKSTNEINSYIEMFNNHYSYGIQCSDQILVNDLKKISHKINELEIILDERYKKERIEKDKKYEEYIRSEEYKEIIKIQKEYNEKLEEEYRIKEVKRLKLWTDEYGVELGTEYFNRL